MLSDSLNTIKMQIIIIWLLSKHIKFFIAVNFAKEEIYSQN